MNIDMADAAMMEYNRLMGLPVDAWKDQIQGIIERAYAAGLTRGADERCMPQSLMGAEHNAADALPPRMQAVRNFMHGPHVLYIDPPQEDRTLSDPPPSSQDTLEERGWPFLQALAKRLGELSQHVRMLDPSGLVIDIGPPGDDPASHLKELRIFFTPLERTKI